MYDNMNLYEGKVRIPSGCAVAGFINTDGKKTNGDTITEMMAVMNERSNGLGAGYAAYGIYPDHSRAYAFHLLLADETVKKEVEDILTRYLIIEDQEEIPVQRVGRFKEAPLVWRYFSQPKPEVTAAGDISEDQLVLKITMEINRMAPKASVMSSGKNSGVFKGVGYPEEIAEFYRLDRYKGYSWIGHGRFPTNTPGWWGGAHPFSLGEISVVHNGELSSYGANKSYLENRGYEMHLLTDTEVLSYGIHFLRSQNFSLNMIAKIFAPPHWAEIERLSENEKELYTALRRMYGGLLMNGPFSIIVAFRGGLMALNDRLKLRPLVIGTKDKEVYMASEEAAIRQVCPHPDEIKSLKAGEAMIGRIEEEAKCHVA